MKKIDIDILLIIILCIFGATTYILFNGKINHNLLMLIIFIVGLIVSIIRKLVSKSPRQ